MQFQTFTVAFDDGPTVEVQNTSRDFVAMERDGVDLATLKPIEGTYTLAWYALRRLARQGKLDDFEVPTLEDFLDGADINTEDPEGNGSGPAPTTGS